MIFFKEILSQPLGARLAPSGKFKSHIHQNHNSRHKTKFIFLNGLGPYKKEFRQIPLGGSRLCKRMQLSAHVKTANERLLP